MRKIIYYLCIACILFLVITLLRQSYDSRRNSSKSGDDIGISEQINRSEELNQQAGAENKSAISHTERAGEYTEQAIQGNQSAQTILAEFRADNRRAKCIIDEIIRGAQEGK